MSVGVIALVVLGARAGEQVYELQYNPFVSQMDSSQSESFTLWQRFKTAFNEQSDEVFANSLYPFKIVTWSMGPPKTAMRLSDRSAKAARGALVKSIAYSAREAAVSLPVMQVKSLFGDFLCNTVDEVDEEAVAPLDPSYRPTESTWWKRMTEGGKLRYGVRPFSTAPYGFLSLRAGSADQLLLLSDVRYYFRNFTDHKFELALTVPLRDGYSIGAGAAYQFGANPDEKNLVLKLAKEFKGGGILYLGLKTKKHPMLLAGLSVSW